MIQLLTDFNLTKWKNIDINSVQKIILRLNQEDLFGELYHPKDPSMDDIININNMAIKIENINLENKKCFGNISFLNDAIGLKAQKIIDSGGRFSIRANAYTSTKNILIFTKITTWDVVE